MEGILIARSAAMRRSGRSGLAPFSGIVFASLETTGLAGDSENRGGGLGTLLLDLVSR